MEKIFISTDVAGLTNAKVKIENLLIDAGRLDAIIQKFTEKRLTQETFEDLLHNKGLKTFESYRAQIDDDTKKLKIKSLYALKDLLTTSAEQFEQELLEVIADTKREGLHPMATYLFCPMQTLTQKDHILFVNDRHLYELSVIYLN